MAPTVSERVRIVRSEQRYHWRNEWLTSHQSFPATGNFDLAANAHGLLMVHNEDVVDAGEGFDTHQHRDTEIVTWVLEGTVVHQDSEGHSGLVHPGLAQRMSAGTGILHSERNGAPRHERRTLHVIQMWIPPDRPGRAPSYQEADIRAELERNELVTVASGMARYRDETAITLGNRYAAFHVARLDPGRAIRLPDAPFGHVFLARGAVRVEGGEADGDAVLHAGDAIRTTATGGQRLTAVQPSEVLLWEMHAGFA
ncbi:pirin family protein [Nocardia veterana]|uniref:Pirin family protein n=1 Tax=Nocardia veterana TaxID=132249 RepID=A0A7X6LUJ4_9NOCA|nr:pirin family protein [Nocardia veterana]NKY84853.1 pirin family protein [Nocardia veterana]